MGKLKQSRVSVRPMGGFVLFMTLIMLVIITISGVAMMKVMDAGTSSAGNIAFRQSATSIGDFAVEAARTWLLAQSTASLSSDNAGAGYYSSAPANFTPSSIDWTDGSVAKYVGQDAHTGYKLYYVIHRFAANAGQSCTSVSAGCITVPASSSEAGGAGTTKTSGTEANAGVQGTGGAVYYRVTVKVVGPKFNSSYVQAVFH